MKIYLYTIIVFLSCAFSLKAQDLDAAWALAMGGRNNEIGESVATDAEENVYIVGNFSDTADFDPGPELLVLTSRGNTDIFVLKLDNMGNLQWAQSIGGVDADFGESIAVDGFGNLYVTGYFFSDTVDFDPGSEILNLTSAGSSDIFVQKLDTEGNMLWTNVMGGPGNDQGIVIATDAQGNAFVTGIFSNTADFDPTEETMEAISAGEEDIFIQKLGPEGNVAWTYTAGGDGVEISTALATDAAGNVLVTGRYEGQVDFDAGAEESFLWPTGTGDVFILKLDDAGGFERAETIGGMDFDFSRALTTDAEGNVYVSGEFTGSVDFDGEGPTEEILSTGGADLFTLKMSAAGLFRWVRVLGGGGGNAVARAMVADRSGNVYTIGSFWLDVDFDPGANEAIRNSEGESDIYVTKMNPEGEFVWARTMGGSSFDFGVSVALDNDDVILTGAFIETIEVNPPPESISMTSAGLADAFVMKLEQPTVGVAEPGNVPEIVVYPNPVIATLSIDRGNAVGLHCALRDLVGKPLWSQFLQNQVTKLDMTAYPAGAYYLVLKDATSTYAHPIVKY